MKLANIKKNKLSAILLDKLPGLTFESNAAKPSPVSIVIAVECLIIPKTNGSNPISTVPNVIPAKLINLLATGIQLDSVTTAMNLMNIWITKWAEKWAINDIRMTERIFPHSNFILEIG